MFHWMFSSISIFCRVWSNIESQFCIWIQKYVLSNFKERDWFHPNKSVAKWPPWSGLLTAYAVPGFLRARGRPHLQVLYSKPRIEYETWHRPIPPEPWPVPPGVFWWIEKAHHFLKVISRQNSWSQMPDMMHTFQAKGHFRYQEWKTRSSHCPQEENCHFTKPAHTSRVSPT